MSGPLATLTLASVAGIGFALATSVAVAIAWALLRRWLHRQHPARRARVALVCAVAPTVVPVLLVALCLAPGGVGLLGFGVDHCIHHPSHPHLCLVHSTAILTFPFVMLLAIGFALVAYAVASYGLRLAAARRTLVQLRSGVVGDLAPGVRCVRSARPFSVTSGMGRGEIFVSSALADALHPSHLEAVIEHERAHVRRRDGLRRMLAHMLSWILPPALRREILAELDLATERACDEEAGGRIGDRFVVAEAILAAERLLGAAPVADDWAFLALGGSSVPARIRGLLAEPAADRRRSGWWWAGALFVASCLLAAPLHHVTEHALALLLGAL